MTSTPSVHLARSITQHTSPWVQAAELNDKARKEAELANTECQNAAQWCCSLPAVSHNFLNNALLQQLVTQTMCLHVKVYRYARF